MIKRRGFVAGVIVLLAGWGVGCTQTTEPPEPMSATDLPNVQVVATLDEPVEANKTVIYCGSFAAAWKEVERKFTKGPVLLKDAPPMAARLNGVSDPATVIPADALYVTAGFGRDDILQTITDGVKQKFGPDEAPTLLPERVDSDDFVAYALLKVVFDFHEPFGRDDDPLAFTATDGKTTQVSAFGLPDDAKHGARDVRKQVAILYENINQETYKIASAAVELDRFNKTHQVIVAMTAPEDTLAKTVAKVESQIKAAAKLRGSADMPALGHGRIFLIPDLTFHLKKQFTPLIDKEFLNPGLQGYFIAEAIQDTQFVLNHKGVKLRSESTLIFKGETEPLVFDKPFLLYIKQRGTDEPYFAMWVSDAGFMTRKE